MRSLVERILNRRTIAFVPGIDPHHDVAAVMSHSNRTRKTPPHTATSITPVKMDGPRRVSDRAVNPPGVYLQRVQRRSSSA